MNQERTSVFSNSLIWFGAAVSIAEIITGTLFAPLGLVNGILAIIIGHLIGGCLLFFAGYIGAKTRKGAMETVKGSFGEKGSMLFSSLNVLQLVGWTAIMIVGGAAAAHTAMDIGGQWIWSLIIGGLILIWLFIGIKNMSKINIVAMSALFLLTIFLSYKIFGTGQVSPVEGELSFGNAIELALAMPLSWLPLISDYTRRAEKPFVATCASASTYVIVSTWMYVIGLGASLYAGKSDIAEILVGAGFSLVALFIVVFSTVTTTFLDVYSAGVSANALNKNFSERTVALVVLAVGLLLALFAPVNAFESFLYLIGSVFAPMITILMVDFFILKHDFSSQAFRWQNLLLWLIGFGLYRYFLSLETPIGNTLPVIAIVAILALVLDKVWGTKNA